MKPDSQIVEEVRARAAKLSAAYQDDLRKYAEHLKEVEARFRDRVVDQPTIVKSREARPGSSSAA